MQRAAEVLLGEHDFTAFRSVECQSKTPVRRIDAARVERDGDYVWLTLTANAYLHHMVRNIVGTLLAVQSAADPAAAMAEVLAGGDRRLGGMTAAAAGLYLWHVEYPSGYAIPRPGQWGFNAGADLI